MTIGSWHRKATIEPANSRLAAVKLTLWCRRKTAAPVKGYRMPAAHGPCGELRRQASNKPQGRKPRADVGTAVPRAGTMGI